MTKNGHLDFGPAARLPPGAESACRHHFGTWLIPGQWWPPFRNLAHSRTLVATNGAAELPPRRASAAQACMHARHTCDQSAYVAIHVEPQTHLYPAKRPLPLRFRSKIQTLRWGRNRSSGLIPTRRPQRNGSFGQTRAKQGGVAPTRRRIQIAQHPPHPKCPQTLPPGPLRLHNNRLRRKRHINPLLHQPLIQPLP